MLRGHDKTANSQSPYKRHFKDTSKKELTKGTSQRPYKVTPKVN